ncbi:hypothetical protein SAMD00019534_067370 [Acytostelium subglobosum LB1]|uniref:hypothetical protein n=1 Tax=Acytostelium subglobosum LB1 TaxID=1410327 RepID=UPI000645126C|nr:hypothetical protein SAMD00019534_067370 [Acytostelium subglobosum LB1]GAM23562.1 hypothetical protein SAMD00019534_067370 [Acytostelium subglobosum LB1]|eukprot:XP_012753303.1 hypothetical protein SAMD00019534_067370 [Acytostelium subglobosum LB1]
MVHINNLLVHNNYFDVLNDNAHSNIVTIDVANILSLCSIYTIMVIIVSCCSIFTFCFASGFVIPRDNTISSSTCSYATSR